MGYRTKQRIYTEEYRMGKTLKEMLNILTHQRNANQNISKIPSYTCQNERMWSKRNTSPLLVGMQIGTTTGKQRNTQAVANAITPIKTKAALKFYPLSILNGKGNTQAVAKPVTPIKTKAALKFYPLSILNGKGRRTNRRGKYGLKRSSTKKCAEEVTLIVQKQKCKDSPLMEEPQPQAEQHAKPAEEQPSTSEARSNRWLSQRRNTQAVAKPVTPIKTKAALKFYPASFLNGKGRRTNRRGKYGLKRSSTKKCAEEVTLIMQKQKCKDSPLMEEPQPQAEQHAKPAEEQPSTSEARSNRWLSQRRNTQAVAKPVTPIKTKAALKFYPLSILNGKGRRTNRCGKYGLRRSSTKKCAEEVTLIVQKKKCKDSPLMEEPQPQAEQHAKPAEEQPSTSEARSNRWLSQRGNTQAVAKPVTPIKTKAALKFYPASFLNGKGRRTNRYGKLGFKRSSTKKCAEEETLIVQKQKCKDSPLMEEPQPQAQQHAKAAEDQPCTS
ncbi:hypothetical protein STEG23_015278 [Scotinomys teguina]